MSSAAGSERVPDTPATKRTKPADGQTPDGIRGPFFQEISKRKSQGRDAKILVTAADGQTGVGKSNLCDFLGYALDTTESGFSREKVAIEPERFLEL